MNTKKTSTPEPTPIDYNKRKILASKIYNRKSYFHSTSPASHRMMKILIRYGGHLAPKKRKIKYK